MFRISIDVGGTFTDLIAFNEETGNLTNIKVPSTPQKPEEGIIEAINQFKERNNVFEINFMGHATTIATNALLGQIDLNIPKIALITTKGFKDIIEIGRQRRAEVYNLFFERPKMLVERKNRYEINERTEYNGQITKKINKNELSEIIRQLIKENIESVAIAFINSYANPENEVETAKEVSKYIKYVSISSQISNEYREYERFSSTVVNASLMPIINRYLNTLENKFESIGIKSSLFIMQSNGGLSSTSNILLKPCTIVESGPAAGVIAAAWVGNLVKENKVISFDMGGTTAKAGTIREGIPEIIPEYEVAGKIHIGRHIKGSGYPVRFPFIDLAECSSGGGTIAWADEVGVLHIGPISAGAYPGPICYGRGGTEPTITDANLLLGRLNSKNLLDGAMTIYPEKVLHAFIELGKKIDLDPTETSTAIIKLANSMMAKILRIVSVERGYDPRDYTVVAFGGAGPMHVCALAEELLIKKVMIPQNPGMFSALGLLSSNIFHDYIKPIVKKIREIDSKSLMGLINEMKLDGEKALLEEKIPKEKMSFLPKADLRYSGQGYELTIDLNDLDIKQIEASFHKKHQDIYSYFNPLEEVELVNLRLRVIGEIEKPKILPLKQVMKLTPIEYRKVFFEDVGWKETPVYKREFNRWNKKLEGPAIIEQYDSTAILYPNWTAENDYIGNLIFRRKNS
ncbi:hydantoinase/oxoprolinase family protein [Candidatus Bathyarchaeota archaeon]|nr:hydantoinase/oxoprolinase family protein [Candidatus Bathyarchaeota archaeon]